MNLTIKDKIILLGCSAFAGLANGFLGGGGGVVVVTLLLTVLKLPQKKAQATALLIILPLTAVSLVVYLLGKDVQWDIVLYSTLGVFLGGT
ncbi:MAG: TSUP family transporter, partial [Clostridia bacterium]|nr:TSUP family transporter [Clostridia bacterium]